MHRLFSLELDDSETNLTQFRLEWLYVFELVNYS
jgi:hypothetical protein